MTKKKFINFISTTMIIFTLMGCFSFAAPKDDIIYNYLYNDIDRILSNINLLSKTVFTTDDYKTPEKKAALFKDIDGYIGEITYLLTQVQNQLGEYSNDKTIQNRLYATSLILAELRYSLVNLKESVMADDKDQKYLFQESFFILKSETIRKIDVAKKIIPK